MRRLLLIAAVLAAPLAARAEPTPDAADVEGAKKRFASGQKLFDSGDFKGAVDEFKEAYRLSHNALLLYNIAFVYDRMGDAALALHFYTRFIDEAEDTEKSHDRLTDAGKRAVELRRVLQAAEPAPAPASQPASAPARVVGLVHEPIDQAPPGRPIDVTARAPDDAGWTVVLFYRGAGEDLYQQVKMKPRLGGELVGRIPAAAVRGNAVHYYLAARDPDGKVVASSGKASTPNVVYLDAGAPLHAILEPGEAVPSAPAAPAPPRDEPGVPRSPFFYAKWSASGGAAILVGAGAAFALAARSQADTLEKEAAKSRSGDCTPGPPCQFYNAPYKQVEADGRSDQRWGNVLLVAGAATAVGAVLFWYLDGREQPVVRPTFNPEAVGAAATVRF
jgi:tetratricopeptide (TPR) repeat protein